MAGTIPARVFVLLFASVAFANGITGFQRLLWLISFGVQWRASLKQVSLLLEGKAGGGLKRKKVIGLYFLKFPCSLVTVLAFYTVAFG